MREIENIGKRERSVRVPGSKSFTQRALVLAALARGESTLRNALISEDTEHLAHALEMLGAGIETRGDGLRVRGTAGDIANPALVRHIEETALVLEVPLEVVRGNALTVLEEWAARGRTFACVFADPPYRFPLQRELLERARRVLAPEGVFVLESDRSFPLEAEARRVYRYGDTVLAVFEG